ncbi:dihydrofolate reductase family protein [Herbiconiux daphne]|uniref:Dihydrofolate reductase family protein n=1 Tax=Herbiconiux daphne TaxID=2970914 RepID=A0ABT2H5P3_9MICO|nr:dihydrofolate reductase family protein [Herbiconiux daphne]MCS5735253.1 dihydrofolate reductase family protein [Herbiconiux daphne]
MSGRIQIDLFSSLDGVQQAPGGPDEDTTDGFAFGGWQAPLIGDDDGAQVADGMKGMDALLLGRRTYDIFAAYWPHQGNGSEADIAHALNSIPKYVASRGNPALTWADSHLLGSDLAAAVADLRDRHDDIHVIGSIDFARSLVTEGLFDQLNLWIYPVVLGAGKRLFPHDGPPVGLTLLSASPASKKGAVLLSYGPTGAPPATGDMTTQQ